MKKIPIVDLLSLVVILSIGVVVYRMEERLDRLELMARGAGDALDSASLLPMPATSASGQVVTIDRGQPRLLFYLSANCGVCARNMSTWRAIADRVGRDHVLFVVGNPAEAPSMPAYLARYGLGGFSAVTADQEIVSRYYMLSVPKTVLVNADGTVAKVWRGVVSTDAVLRGWDSILKHQGA